MHAQTDAQTHRNRLPCADPTAAAVQGRRRAALQLGGCSDHWRQAAVASSAATLKGVGHKLGAGCAHETWAARVHRDVFQMTGLKLRLPAYHVPAHASGGGRTCGLHHTVLGHCWPPASRRLLCHAHGLCVAVACVQLHAF